MTHHPEKENWYKATYKNYSDTTHELDLELNISGTAADYNLYPIYNISGEVTRANSENFHLNAILIFLSKKNNNTCDTVGHDTSKVAITIELEKMSEKENTPLFKFDTFENGEETLIILHHDVPFKYEDVDIALSNIQEYYDLVASVPTCHVYGTLGEPKPKAKNIPDFQPRVAGMTLIRKPL